MAVTFPDAVIERADRLLALCRAGGLRVATAESCTGGLIAACLTEIAGSSDVVDRGFVTYANEAKHDLLGVPDELLIRVGAVSEEVARAMAEGALERSDAHLAVAVTGIAGPGGGTATKAGRPGAPCLRGAGRRDLAPARGLSGRSRRGSPRNRRDRARHADRRC